ncbi:hypothetical protein GGF37_000508 [Kickxella alabastrina]|nr:hypothetical protein GGF37_000508 [Kickxella alabastrina]
MAIPINKYSPTRVGRSGSKHGSESSLVPSSRGYESEDPSVNYYAGGYESQWTTADNTRIYVNQNHLAHSRSPTPSFLPPHPTIANSVAHSASVSSQRTVANHSTVKINEPLVAEAPLGKKARAFLIILRSIHTLTGLMLLSSIGGMQAYMLLSKISILIIPLFICRLFLMSALVVFILCDWSLPKKVHFHFPMYSNKRSWKGLGMSQLVISMFVLGDSALISLEKDREGSQFARILFPLVVTFSSMMVLVGLIYFVLGAVGGAKLKRRLTGC